MVTAQSGDNSKCSHRSTPVQCNWLGRWASRAHRNARTRARRTWLNLWSANRDEITHAVFWTDLGEIPNWGSLVDNQRHGWVHWVLDYMAEPMARSIYRIRGKWLVNLDWRTGGRREEMSHHGDLPWWSQSNELWRSLGSHYGSRQRDKCPKAWHHHGEWRTCRWQPLGHVAGASGWVKERTVPPSSSVARSFTRGSLSVFN
jgi:hypothetical protein